MDTEEKCLKENILYKGRIIELYNDDVETPYGHQVQREYIKHPGGVCCLAYHQGYIYLEKQFRYCFHQEILELPAGKLEKGEEPMEAMKRELIEEVGLKSHNLIALGKIYPSVGISNEIIYLFLSLDNEEINTAPDEDEIIKIVKMTPEEVYDLLDKNRISDAKTVVALTRARKVFKE